MHHDLPAGFTLIELLVVITVVVVLLALLAPALDKAMYEAELASCAAQQKGMATGAVTYAVEHGRYYPHRPQADGGWWWPHFIFDGVFDVRSLLAGYVDNDMHNDPLGGGVDYDKAATQDSGVIGNYLMWFGFRYAGHPGMRRVGDRLLWSDDLNGDGTPERLEFNFLVSDWDLRWTGDGVQGSHPDDLGVMHFTVEQNQAPTDTGLTGNASADAALLGRWSVSRWIDRNNRDRGLIDQNYAYQDGSVTRVPDMKPNWIDDARLTRVPQEANAATYPTVVILQVPRQH